MQLGAIGEHMEKRFNLKKLLATRGTKSIATFIQPSLCMYYILFKTIFFMLYSSTNKDIFRAKPCYTSTGLRWIE